MLLKMLTFLSVCLINTEQWLERPVKIKEPYTTGIFVGIYGGLVPVYCISKYFLLQDSLSIISQNMQNSALKKHP